MDVPHVKREDYQLTDISDDGYLTLMSDNGEIREDLKLPEGDLGNSLRTDFDNGKDLLVSGVITKLSVYVPSKITTSIFIMLIVYCPQVLRRRMRYCY